MHPTYLMVTRWDTNQGLGKVINYSSKRQVLFLFIRYDPKACHYDKGERLNGAHMEDKIVKTKRELATIKK